MFTRRQYLQVIAALLLWVIASICLAILKWSGLTRMDWIWVLMPLYIMPGWFIANAVAMLTISWWKVFNHYIKGLRLIWPLLLLISLSSCMTDKRVARWLDKRGGEFTTTKEVQIIKTDTVYTYVEGDTVLLETLIRELDTILVDGRAEVQVKIETDTVTMLRYLTVKGYCKPDTITQLRVDTLTVSITNTAKLERTYPFWKGATVVLLGLIIALLIFAALRKLFKF